MTVLSRGMSFFPLIMILGIVFLLIFFFADPGFVSTALLLSYTYLLPPLAYRIHNALCPIGQGVSDLRSSVYSSWWGGHQIQVIYTAIPQLEAVLRIVPGAYSAWLRLWGSKVGKNVYWTPVVMIEDRGLMNIGNGVIFGHFFRCACHVIKPSENRLVLYVKEIVIGDQAFLGAGSTLGPGTKIKDSEFIPVLSVRSFGINE